MAATTKMKNALGATSTISKNRSKPGARNNHAAPGSASRTTPGNKRKFQAKTASEGNKRKPWTPKGKMADGSGSSSQGKKRKPEDSDSGTPDKKKRKFNTNDDGEKKFDGKSKPAKPLDRKARKELAETRKRKRKPDFDLEKDVVLLWEKMRRRNLSDEERKSIVSTTLEKTKGKRLQMAKCHSTSRVLQSCVKHCTESERKEVFEELKPHFLELVPDVYGCHLAQRMLDHAKKEQFRQLVSSLHGHVVRLLRHPSGSTVVERAYQMANGAQKYDLVSEFYAPEFRLFKNIHEGKTRLSEIFSTESPSRRKVILEHMTRSIQPILDKEIVDHSLIHRALVEYLSISSKKQIEAAVEQLAGPLLVRMIHTAEGARIAILCIRTATAKGRKKIVKGMKDQAVKVACDDHGYMVLLSIFDVVDDTDLVSKCIMTELVKEMKDLCLNKYGHRLILHLLAPDTRRYFPSDLQELLHCPVKILSGAKAEADSKHTEAQGDEDKDEGNIKDDVEKLGDGQQQQQEEQVEEDDDNIVGDVAVSKKDPTLRRTELLTKGGFAKKLTEACAAHAGELLRSPVGKDVIYEVASGEVDGVTFTSEGVTAVHKAIADLAAFPKDGEGATEEHVMEQYHASRTIRRLLLDSSKSPKSGAMKSFAQVLYDTALKGRLTNWAQGHSLKVVAALRDSQDPSLSRAAKSEIQSLIASGLLEPSRPGANPK